MTDLTECEGDYYCHECLDRETIICSHCGNRILFDDNAGTEDFPLCQNCYDNHYTSCARCGSLIHQDDACYDDDDNYDACMNEKGKALLSDVVEAFTWYYEDRIQNGLPAEKKNCIFTKGGYTAKDVEKLILSMPFKRFEGMGYMRHSKYLGIIQIDKSIMKDWTDTDAEDLQKCCSDALKRYWG